MEYWKYCSRYGKDCSGGGDTLIMFLGLFSLQEYEYECRVRSDDDDVHCRNTNMNMERGPLVLSDTEEENVQTK